MYPCVHTCLFFFKSQGVSTVRSVQALAVSPFTDMQDVARVSIFFFPGSISVDKQEYELHCVRLAESVSI